MAELDDISTIGQIGQLRPDVKTRVAVEALNTLPEQQQMEVTTEAFQNLDSKAQKTLLQRSGVGSPEQSTANRLWMIAIIVIGGALALSVIGLVAGWGDNKSVLLVFTTSIGALTGLFAPSPLQGQS